MRGYGSNGTRKWPTRQQERRAKLGVIVIWWILVPAMLLSYFYAPELRAFFHR